MLFVLTGRLKALSKQTIRIAVDRPFLSCEGQENKTKQKQGRHDHSSRTTYSTRQIQSFPKLSSSSPFSLNSQFRGAYTLQHDGFKQTSKKRHKSLLFACFNALQFIQCRTGQIPRCWLFVYNQYGYTDAVLHRSQMKREGKKDQSREQREATLQLAKQSFDHLSKKICQILVAPVLPRHVGQTNTLLQEKLEKNTSKLCQTKINSSEFAWGS